MTSGAWSCPSCGTANVATLKFCGECGTKRQRTEHTLSGDHTQAGTTPRHASSPDATLGGAATYAGSSSSPVPTSSLRAGLRVGRDARYELIAKLGEGGMGAVWKGRDVQLGREVAIKRILGHGSAVLRERFQRETQAVVGLRHPNIVTVHDAGEDEHGLYLVMEFVPGKTLAAHLQQGALEPEAAVETMLGLCRGAAHAHKKGVVHRDIKPGNVMLDDDGIPRLLDFGLVRMEGASELSLTGMGMGTLDYAAPEQKRDASKADARSDVYALGLVFYEMLTGLRPPVTLRRLPEIWRNLVEKATDGVADGRQANADELLAEIEAVQHSASSETAAAQLLGTGDDLRCPKCKLLNALEAKFCRACRESLRMACPACAEPIRTGLQQCDQCSASITDVRRLQEELPRAQAEIASGELATARLRLTGLSDLLGRGALGMASKMEGQVNQLVSSIPKRAQMAQSILIAAEQAALVEDVEKAVEKWEEAKSLDRGLGVHAAKMVSLLQSAQTAKEAGEGRIKDTLSKLEDALAGDRFDEVEVGTKNLLRSLDLARHVWQSAWEGRCILLLKKSRERHHNFVRDRFQKELPLLLKELGAGDLVGARQRVASLKSHEGALDPKEDGHLCGQFHDLAGKSQQQEARASELLAAVDASLAREDLPAAKAQLAEALRLDRSNLKIAAEKEVLMLQVHAAKSAAEEVLKAQFNDLEMGLADGRVDYVLAGAERMLESLDVSCHAWHLTWQQRCETILAKASALKLAADRRRAQEGLQGAIAAVHAAVREGDLNAAKEFSESIPSFRSSVGVDFWNGCVRERVAAAWNTDRLESSIASRRRLVIAGRAAAAVAFIGLCVYLWSAWERHAAEERLFTAQIEEVRTGLAAGDRRALLAWRELKSERPEDARVLALAPEAETVGGAWLAQSLAGLESRLQAGEADALPEWRDLEAWFGADARLDPLRPAAAAAAERERPWRELRAAGFREVVGSTTDPKTGFPMRIAHEATGAVLVLIPAGTFSMGSPATEVNRDSDEMEHSRVIRKPFYLGETEVTQAQWELVMGSNPSQFRAADLPVETVSWDDCQVFLRKAGSGLRLPSEAEWEYACRAGTTTPFSFGATITPEQVNYNGNRPYGNAPKGRYREQTVACRSLPANPWGLYEMHGNVWEWCQDVKADYPGHSDERAWEQGAGARVLRGGGWRFSGRLCRSASRLGNDPDGRNDNVGLRLARTLPE